VRDPSPIDQTLAVADYAYPFDALISRFKFNDALDLAGALARRLADVVEATGDARPHWVVPAPLSRERLRERGYNQAWELARRVARSLGCKADAMLLLRVKDTPHQLALPREERAANVRGAFLVEPRRTHELRGRDVAVVDDVMTTGATGAEIARTLKQAGAQRVRLWVIARTPAQ
jgi:ComF family protein